MEKMQKVGFGELVLASPPDRPEKTAEPASRKRRASGPEFEVTCSGVDFTVRRRTAKTSRLLVILVSQGQYYLKDEVTGRIEALDAEVLERALDGLDGPVELECPWVEHVPHGKAERESFARALTTPGFELVAKTELAVFSGSRWEPRGPIVREPSGRAWFESVKGLAETSLPLARHVAKAMAGPAAYDMAQNIEAFAAVCRAYGLDRARDFVDAYGRRVTDTRELGIQGHSLSFSLYKLPGLMRTPEHPGDGGPDFDRMCDYLFRQSLSEGTPSLRKWLDTWEDALEMQDALYGEVRDRYPRNLMTAHDMLALKAAISKAEVDARRWARVEKAMACFDWEPEGAPFVMTHPVSADDLRVESTALSHCVAGYANKITRGDSLVFFCRRSEDRNTPYVTVEVDPKRMRLVQVKARFNQAPAPGAMEFVDRWCAEHGIDFGRRAA